MPVRVTPEQINHAKQIDILSYLMESEPDNLRKLGKDTYCTVEHDSLKISNGLWHWFSHHIGGRNALDYLMKVRGVSFTQSVMMLCSHRAFFQPVQTKVTPDKPFELPVFHTNIQRVKNYLVRRGINGRLVDYCYEHGVLSEDAKYHNCVFIGRDDSGTPRFACVRSTTSDFKRDLEGSDKQYSFRLCLDDHSPDVHVFEAPIDLLSYITLASMKHREWYYDNYLSLGGVYVTENKADVPVALADYLEKHPDTVCVVLHLDNDTIGKKAAEQIAGALGDRFTVINEPPKNGKDFNDYLQTEIKRRKERER